jgi:pimeloyl-ACP methyl ester carboxylesterase
MNMRRPPSPPGQLVEITSDGQAGPACLHLWRQGQGRPAAVLDTGLSGNCLLWTNVLAALAPITEACAFDRAGSGWSDPPPAGQPRTSHRMVDELRRALLRAGLAPPYILLGHSAGAIHMLVFAKHYPAEVAGLVLVDPSHPEMFRRVPGVPGARATTAMMGALAALGRLGLGRWLGPAYLKGLLPHGERQLPAPVWAAMRYFARQGREFAAAAREAAVADESFADARGGPGSLGDLPLSVLTAEWWVTGKPSKLKQAFVPLREELARYSTRGRHMIVSGCDHANMPVVRADAVADAVRQVLEMR